MNSRGDTPARIAVVFDGGCGLCAGTARFLHAWDLRSRLEWIDLSDWAAVTSRFPALDAARCAARIHAVRGDGSVLEGFRALRSILAQMPLLWPVVPLLHIPGATRLGERVYDAIAARRHGDSCLRTRGPRKLGDGE